MSGTAYDAIVLGSGFGGSLLATILSRQGMRVALLETSRHPRFAIGESSTPAADLILHDLAMRYDLPELRPLCRFGTWQESHPELRCGCKRGFSYFSHGSGDEFAASNDHTHELLVAASAFRDVADTQWYRPDVDQFYFELAKSRGTDVWEGIENLQLRNEGPSDWQIEFHRANQLHKLNGRFLIDATGPRGIVLKELGIQSSANSLHTHSTALYGHWENLPRLDDVLRDRGVHVEDYPFPSDDAAVHHLFRDGWMWSLRFEDGLTSVGFVSDTRNNSSLRIDQPEQQWKKVVERSPLLESVFQSARLADWPGKLFQTNRLQRIAERGAGDDWAAIPATVGFIDPLHSTGIAHTISAIEELSRILLRCQDRHAELQAYSDRILRELRWVDLLVAGCYRGLADFELFITWSMIYFAAATTFESRRMSPSSETAGDFLCADDRVLQESVSELWTHLQELTAAGRSLDQVDIDSFRERVQEAIVPYNRVGLFSAEQPHLYFHTVAKKE